MRVLFLPTEERGGKRNLCYRAGGVVIVLAIDPGREKCGLAVAAGNRILWQEVVARDQYLALLPKLLAQYGVECIILGDQTGSADFYREISGALPNYPLFLVNEYKSSEEARRRYWLACPPKGWRRLIPTSFQLPPEPYDDYVAVILAERYLKGKK